MRGKERKGKRRERGRQEEKKMKVRRNKRKRKRKRKRGEERLHGQGFERTIRQEKIKENGEVVRRRRRRRATFSKGERIQRWHRCQ